MRALVISGGEQGFAGGVAISLERKNEYDILLVLQLEVLPIPHLNKTEKKRYLLCKSKKCF
jgi:hypothetical protein